MFWVFGIEKDKFINPYHLLNVSCIKKGDV